MLLPLHRQPPRRIADTSMESTAASAARSCWDADWARSDRGSAYSEHIVGARRTLPQNAFQLSHALVLRFISVVAIIVFALFRDLPLPVNFFFSHNAPFASVAHDTIVDHRLVIRIHERRRFIDPVPIMLP